MSENTDYFEMPLTELLTQGRREVYKTAGDPSRAGDLELPLYIFEPAEQSPLPRPAMVLFFGGGWKGGDPSKMTRQAIYLAAQGMTTILPDYRVANRHGTDVAAAMEDARDAIAYVYKHADRLGIDPARLCAGGGSAGGHVALCTAVFYAEEKYIPKALVLFNPVVDTTEAGYGADCFTDPIAASPVHHLRAGLPPTLLCHGDTDRTVPYENATRFTSQMNALGNHCELETYPGRDHAFYNHAHTGDCQSTSARAATFLRTIDML